MQTLKNKEQVEIFIWMLTVHTLQTLVYLAAAKAFERTMDRPLCVVMDLAEDINKSSFFLKFKDEVAPFLSEKHSAEWSEPTHETQIRVLVLLKDPGDEKSTRRAILWADAGVPAVPYADYKNSYEDLLVHYGPGSVIE